MVPLDRPERNAGDALARAVMKPLDLTEWAQALRMASASDVADFAQEVLDLIELEPVAAQYWELVELLEKATSKKFEPPNPDRLPECWGGYVEKLVSEKEQRLEKMRERALWINAADIPPPMEYDL